MHDSTKPLNAADSPERPCKGFWFSGVYNSRREVTMMTKPMMTNMLSCALFSIAVSLWTEVFIGFSLFCGDGERFKKCRRIEGIMPSCDMCGKEGAGAIALIEGVELTVCQNCARFGKITRTLHAEAP